MRVLHTSDWHLGQVLRDCPREPEHAVFLRWLVATVAAEQVDVVLITGDVFDSSLPSALAEAMWFQFLAELRTARPSVSVVVIAGNHDSPSRLAAPARLFAQLGVHVVTTVSDDAGGTERCIVELEQAVVVAMPFLRPIDLPAGLDPVAGTRARFAHALEAAQAVRRGRPIMVMAHLYATGADTEWLSERRASMGGAEAVSADLFGAGDGVAYVALGHIHKAQQVAHEHVRYAGAPLALAVNERHYPHQVVVVDVHGERATSIRSLPVPQPVSMLRVPAHGRLSVDQGLAALRRLLASGRVSQQAEGEASGPVMPAQVGTSPIDNAVAALDPRPYLEVCLELDAPRPQLRQEVEAALSGAAVRLVKLTAELTGTQAPLATALPGQMLAELSPVEVLRRRWARDYKAELPMELVAEFETALRMAESGADAGGEA